MTEKKQASQILLQPKANPRKQRVAAYCCVTSQAEMPIHSPNIQAEYFKLLFDQHNDWECAGIFTDEASSPNRAQFLHMIEKCRAGEIDAVIAKSIARFGRNMLDTLLITRELQHLGIDVYFEKENLHSCSPAGEKMLKLMAEFTEVEADSI